MRLRSADLSMRRLGEETIVLNLATSRYFTVTGVGTRLVELMAEDTSVDELIEVITEEYQVDSALARRDVSEFVDRLHAAQLVE